MYAVNGKRKTSRRGVMELQYSTARGSEIDTAVKSESARNVRTTATKAVTGVALLKSVTCG
jgi:hypothetical protein